MGTYRNYFSKNNTIIRDSDVNTANNPITELKFGNSVTRFLFFVDMETILSKVASKEIIITDDTRHYLKLFATNDFSINPYLNSSYNITLDESYRPTSFDLELHAITEDWDAGSGYDFALNDNRRTEDMDFLKGPSNWWYSTSQNEWSTYGAIPTNSEPIAIQHFDDGSENIEMDITDYVNGIIDGTIDNYKGFCLKYSDLFEVTGNTREYKIGFFTKKTQSFFEPFIETKFDDLIKDDRGRLYTNKTNRLYLYVNVGGMLTNLDELPSCNVGGLTNIPVVHQSKGVYYVEFYTDADYFTTYKKYYDTWGNLKVDGKNLRDIRMDFIPKDEAEYYQVGDEMVLPVHYGLSLSGIKQEEKLTNGEIRRINVHARKPYTVNQSDVIDEISYRLYTKVGITQQVIIDWSQVSRSNLYNFFTLDTSWLIPNKYYVDIMIKQNGESLLYNDSLTFNVVSSKKI